MSTQMITARPGPRRLGQISSHLLHNSATSTRRPTRYLCSASNTGNPTDEKQGDEPIKVSHSERTENVPNETWSKETLDLYNELQNLVESSNGAWFKHYPKKNTPGYRLFLHCVDEKGKLIEYFCIYNKREKCLKGVCQFGPYTEGPARYVHGGAIATVLDVATVALAVLCEHLQLPIGSTVLFESKIKSIERRKIFIDAEMTSPDGLHIYATAKTLCVKFIS